MRKNIFVGLSGFCLVLAIGACAFLSTGCEDSDSTSELSVSPSDVVLSGTSNVVRFTVSSNGLQELSLPLTWSVSSSGLGGFGATEGYSAIYIRKSAAGVNIIGVRDQYGTTGTATVDQR